MGNIILSSAGETLTTADDKIGIAYQTLKDIM
jgi:hypothetical protein